MVDTKITDLTAATDTDETDVLSGVDVSAVLNKKFSLSAIAKHINTRSSVFNVLDYGADGGGGDQTSEIQSAIDAAEAVGGGSVIINSGDYNITSSLTIQNNDIAIYIDAGATITADSTFSPNSTGMFHIGDGSTAYSGIFIYGYGTLDGNDETIYGIYGSGPLTNIRIDGLNITNTGIMAILIDGLDYSTESKDIFMTNLNIYDVYEGPQIRYCRRSIFSNNKVDVVTGTQDCFETVNCFNVNISDNIFKDPGSGNACVDIFDVNSNISISGNVFISSDDASNTRGITIGSGAVNSANFTTNFAINNKLTSTSHGLSNGHMVRVDSTNTLPAGMIGYTDYFIINSTTNDFEISSTPGGTSITLTSDGTGTHNFRQVDVSNCSISGNVFQGNFNASVVIANKNEAVSIVGNQFNGAGGSSPSWINFQGGGMCANNVFTSSSGAGTNYGIRIQSAGDPVLLYNNIIGASITYCVYIQANASRGRHTISGNNFVTSADNFRLIGHSSASTVDYLCENNSFGDITDNTTAQVSILNMDQLTSATIRNNSGVKTEANGTATISNGSTSTGNVAHDLGNQYGSTNYNLTPTKVTATPIEDMGSATKFWITFDNNNIVINVDQNPGQDVDFQWTAVALQ